MIYDGLKLWCRYNITFNFGAAPMGTKRIILHAPNVHCGGGKVLLDQLLTALQNCKSDVILHLDARYQLPVNVTFERVSQFPNTLAGRFHAEKQLKKLARDNDIVMCFGNLPPLLKLPSTIYVYLQNKAIFHQQKWHDYPMSVAIRLGIEYLWLKLFAHRVNCFYVQTNSMHSLVLNELGKNKKCKIFPFADVSQFSQNTGSPPQYDFIYPVSDDPHKNHMLLVRAWLGMARNDIYPTLALTLPKDSKLWSQIAQISEEYHLKITNLGTYAHADMPSLLQKARALIYPALFESFGLPLIEAKAAGLAIVAPETDYIRDVVDPDETFNLSSDISVMRAVLRFLKKQPERTIPTANVFVEQVLS